MTITIFILVEENKCSAYALNSDGVLQNELMFWYNYIRTLVPPNRGLPVRAGGNCCLGGNTMAKADTMNLLEFQRMFSTEEACEKYLFEKRWPDGFKCPKCGHGEYYYIGTRRLYECKGCSYQASVTAGTVMHRSKLDLAVWFWTIYLVSNDKRGRSALSISQVLDLNYRTAWRLLHKIRHAMSERDANYQLAGFVEMDDAYFGAPRPGTDGRGSTKAKVAIALSTDEEGHPLYTRMRVIEAVSTKEIKKAAEEFIKKGSTISSDACAP